MPRLTDQATLRTIRHIGFCYLCGDSLPSMGCPGRNRDHVPPSSLFLPQDRTPPVILPTHTTCNNSQTSTDEIMGQLISLIHGTPPKPNRLKAAVYATPVIGIPLLAIDHNLHSAIWRWIRGFHAALYATPLPDSAERWIGTPLPALKIGESPAGENLSQHRLVVEQVKRNRAAGRFDEIRCRNRQLRYECTWQESDNGLNWMCFWGLDIYGWKSLGDRRHFHPRGCVGLYVLAQPPVTATRGTRIHTPYLNSHPLDPFGA